MNQNKQETYAVLRYGGASMARACAEIYVSSGRGMVLEAIFQVRRPGAGGDAMRPRFARHAAHVAATTAAGGYPALRL